MAERLTRAQQQARTRERLLDAAETLFGERGIHQTSLDEIAAAAGLTKGAIYANFGGKKDLIAAIMERKLTDNDPVDHRMTWATWADEFGDTYENNMGRPEVRRFAMAFSELWLYAMREPGDDAPMRQWLRTVRDLNARELSAAAGDDLPMPVERLSALVLAVDIGVALQHLIDPEAVPADLYRTALEAFMGKSTTPDEAP